MGGDKTRQLFRVTRIPRFTSEADPGLMDLYETTGEIERPVVTLHTTGGPIVPHRHEPLYR